MPPITAPAIAPVTMELPGATLGPAEEEDVLAVLVGPSEGCGILPSPDGQRFV